MRPEERQLQQMFQAMQNGRFISTTSPVVHNNDNADEIPPSNVITSPKTPARKRQITGASKMPATANSPITKSPITSDRLTKKIKLTGNTNENLIIILLGEVSLKKYAEAINTLQSLSTDLASLNSTQLSSIFDTLTTLSNTLAPSDPNFELLQNVFAKFLTVETTDLNLDDVKKLNIRNQLLLDRYKLEQAIANKDYKTAIDLFISLSAKNATQAFTHAEIVNLYSVLTSNTTFSENFYRLSELQEIIGGCIEYAKKMQESIRTEFLQPDFQECYYYYQSILEHHNNQPFEEINALLMAIAKAGDRLVHESQQSEEQQETAIRIHQYLATAQSLIETSEYSEHFLDELSVLRQSLQDYFRAIEPSHRTADDWKILPYNEYEQETWTLLYNAELDEIKTAAEESPQRIQALILFMQCDQVSHPATCFMRLITLYQRLYILCQKSPDNKVQFDLMMQHMDSLSKAIEKNEDVGKESKDLLAETKNTFLLNNIFKAKKESSEATASHSNDKQSPQHDTASTASLKS